MLPYGIYPRRRSPSDCREWQGDGQGTDDRMCQCTVPKFPLRTTGALASPLGKLERHSLGDLTVTFLEVQPDSLRQAGWPLAPQRDFVLVQARRGESRFRFPQGEITAGPRDCILIHPGERCETVCTLQTSAIALSLPEQWLKRWLPRLDPSPHLFRAGEGWNAALCTVVGTLTPGTIRELTLPGSVLADNIGTLLALAAGPHSQGPPLSLFDSLSQGLRASLHRPELSPARLAASHQISLRALHYAFATGQTTFMKELIRARLERSAELLTEGRVKLTVEEVAKRCGFTDTSHFTRRFRERFGQTPAKFRSNARLERASSLHPSIPGRLARERFVHKLDESSHLG
jgi:AraC-like DNA-binding protein